MKKTTRYTVTFGTSYTNSLPYTLAGLFDMLRYDNARVVSWSGPTDRGVMTLTLEAERPEFRRWRSMGIVPTEVA